VCENFAYLKGSWRVNQHVRLVGAVKGPQRIIHASQDAPGDAERTPRATATTGARQAHSPSSPTASVGGTSIFGRAPGDLVGFGDAGVWIAFNNGDGTFGPVQFVVPNFGVKQSWRVDRDTRTMADLGGKGFDSIVGFGEEGVWFAVNDTHGGFASPQFIQAFGYTQGWRLHDHPRFAADLNETGRADLVGFGEDGVYVAYNDGNNSFMAVRRVVDNQLCFSQGWGAEQPRFAARITEKRRADLVGFGNDGVWAAFHNDDGTFTPAFVLKDSFAYNLGWRVSRHPRFVADLTGNGLADLVGFWDDDVWVSLNVNGVFQPAQPAGVNNLCYNQGWRVEIHPRFLADVTGNGRPDIVGFGDDGVWVAPNRGDGTFAPATFVLNDFGARSMKARIEHVFVMIMENRSFDHMLGMSGITGTDAETGELTTINGLTGKESNSLSDPPGTTFSVGPGAPDTMPVDPGHGFFNTLIELAGKGADNDWKANPGPYPPINRRIDNSGFVQQYADEGGADPGQIMKCFVPTELPVLQQLASEFVVCDQWYSSLPGPTWPNRFFAHAASSGGLEENPSPSDIAKWETLPSAGFGFHNGTIYDALGRRGIRYKFYCGDGFPVVSGLKGISNAFDISSFSDMVDDIRGQDFASIFYVHIEPHYDILNHFRNGNSQHPLASVANGERLIKFIYELIRNSPVHGELKAA
jgi:hypothetical protein